MSKKSNILTDLESGKLVNMFDDLKRYGSSLRSRISELRASGHNIESKVIDKSGALAYFMREHIKKENKKTCRDCNFFANFPTIVDGECSMTIRVMHIDDECEYEITEEQMNFHKEVDERIKAAK